MYQKNYTFFSYIVACLLLIGLIPNTIQGQTLIAGWDFQTNTSGGTTILAGPSTQTQFNANFGTGTLYLNGSNGSSSWLTASQLNGFGGTSLNAGAGFSAVTTSPACLALTNQTANGQSIVFKLNMTDYANLVISYATQKTTTGFATQTWQYSTNGTTWLPIQTISSVPTSFATQTLNTITGLDNISTAYIKLSVSGASSAGGNNRLDNIQMNANYIGPCALNLTASGNNIACNGGTSSITANASNGFGTYTYQLNGGSYQASNVFSNLTAGIYTIQVKDANLCTTTSTIELTQPAGVSVSANAINACDGVPVDLDGSPAGGSFSVANPYLGPTTTYTYAYTDTNGCVYTSPAVDINVSPCTLLSLKVFLQGYYTGSGTMAPVLLNQGVGNNINLVDDITVELHEITTFDLVSTSTGVLHTDGTVLLSYPPLNGSYFLVVKHRNSIWTCSANPVTLGNTLVTYDFTTSASQAYQLNQIEMEPGIWALYSADINQDGYVDGSDYPDFDLDAQTNVFGIYSLTDLNGDGYVDASAYPIFDLNSQFNVASILPAQIIFPENFELGTKSAYSTANEGLGSGSWNFNDALIGSSASDRKNATKSARIQNSGKITMNFDVVVDTPTISLVHAKFGTDANSTWGLFSSTNGGSTWTQEGVSITSSLTTLSTVNFVVNYAGNIRFEIRKLSGGSTRINIDDFSIQNTAPLISLADNDPLSMGNPSMATTDISFPNNYLLTKPQYALAYNNTKGTAAWVAWHFDINDRGTTPRCDCFTTDLSLPASFYRASPSSYTSSGFDRGHMQPSAQRNNNITNNAATFLMSNMLPQAPNLNQITWNNLEQYCITLVNSGYELYTYSGGYGMGGNGSNGGTTQTLDNGNITVPSRNWKIILVLPVGSNDVSRVATNTRVIAVDMPNTQSVNVQPWGYYRTSVDAIESATGFDFFSTISTTLQNAIEPLVDAGPVN